MRKVVGGLVVGLLLVAGMTSAAAQSVDSIDSYGLYVAAARGYVKVAPYSHYGRFVDFKFLNEIPSVKRPSDSLKIIVYEKGFSEASIAMQARPVDVVVRLQPLKYSIKPLGKADMYELTIDSPIKDGAILQVYSWFYDNMGVIMLGDTQSELVKYFSQKDLPKPYAVNQYLDDALVAFPQNEELKGLKGYWQKAAEAEKDKEAYAYVEEKWKNYEQAKKLTLKRRYLNALVGEINGYLGQFPNGSKAAEAKQRRSVAEKKLKEYEGLL